MLLAAAIAPVPAATTTWSAAAGGAKIFQLEIHEGPPGTTATWLRPQTFQLDGDSFSHVDGPVIRRGSRTVRVVDGDLELTFDDPKPGETPDILRLHRVDADHAQAILVGMPFDPLDLERETGRSAPIGPWDKSRTYPISAYWSTNAEMTAIFDADQADRMGGDPWRIDWSVVAKADAKRRKRTQELLDLGALKSGEDFYNAAFVFQHGDSPDDHLKAHVLATIAIARGKAGAIWIASATLDRYLQGIGRPQIFGTQFNLPKDGSVTQEPFDRTLISDAIRKALHVPTLAVQKDQLVDHEKKAKADKQPGHSQDPRAGHKSE